MYCPSMLSVFFVSLVIAGVNCDFPVRRTANGPVEGVELISSLGQKYYAFKGVPYAEPPITGKDPYTGENIDRRFKAPEPLKRTWTDNLKAHNFGDVCIPAIHLFELKSKSSEDCLFLNIYVPANESENKTVLVWIHGGFFIGGEPTDLVYGPDFLLSANNIVITVHYRLAIFGFLNLGFGEYTGNMGLKDQQLALKWIHENIENFSGNKNEVLLFGISAGGSAINFHMLNEESRKYFRRAFLASGSALSYFGLSEGNHLKRMQEFSNINEQTELIEYLKTADSKVLAECDQLKGFGKLLYSPWEPTIESPGKNKAFISERPEEMYMSGKGSAMDSMFSFTAREYITFDTNPSSEPLIKKSGEETDLPLSFGDSDRGTNPKIYEEAVKKLREAYFRDLNNPEAIKQGNVNLISDLNFGYSVLKAAMLQTSVNNGNADHRNTFLFRFSIDAGLNVFKLKYNLKYDGAGHVDELCYIFHCHMLDQSKVYDSHLENKDESYDAIMRMVQIISNFARTGNPSIEGDTPFKSSTSPSKIFCQDITNDSKSTLITNITDELHFETWREIEDSYRK